MKKRFDREPVCCAVCRREAIGLGYTPRCGAPIAWLCDDADCISLGKLVYRMSERDLTFHERAALDAAGGEAGAYLARNDDARNWRAVSIDALTQEAGIDVFPGLPAAARDPMTVRTRQEHR